MAPGEGAKPPTTRISSSGDDDADERADRQVLQEALLQLGEVDVEHHDDEEEEHGDGADIDDDQDHRQEFCAQQQEEARRVDEGEDEEQDRVHRVARGDHHERGCDHDAREEIEKGCRHTHFQSPSASARAAVA